MNWRVKKQVLNDYKLISLLLFTGWRSTLGGFLIKSLETSHCAQVSLKHLCLCKILFFETKGIGQ